MQSKEVELKYRADQVSLQAFKKLCKDHYGVHDKFLIASGYDHFYANKEDITGFYRHRVGPDMNQLTYKRKTTDKNNFVRDEDNLDFKGTTTEKHVEAYLSRFGYSFNTSIFKNCFIYKYEKYTLVFYVTYDLNLKESGRFLEIEMSESYEWENVDHAWNELLALEQKLSIVGITPQHRVKKSLFELYRKNG